MRSAGDALSSADCTEAEDMTDETSGEAALERNCSTLLAPELDTPGLAAGIELINQAYRPVFATVPDPPSVLPEAPPCCSNRKSFCNLT